MNGINCTAFERWLDEGADRTQEQAMHAHADTCARCAAAWAAMRDVDAWMIAPVAAPAGFSDAVMSRIERIAHVPAAAPVEDMPWWVSIIQQPAVVLASLVAALLLWRADVLVAAAAAAATWIANVAQSAGATTANWAASLGGGPAHGLPAAGGSHSLVAAGLALGLAPVLAIASLALSGWVTRWVARRTLSA